MIIKAWWFTNSRKLPNGDGRQIRVGRVHKHKGELLICQSGLHASKRIIDALRYAKGSILCRVECSGDVIEQDDKLVCSERKYLAIVDAEDMLRKFARLCALDVIHLKTGDERAGASDASWAARAASWAASKAASRVAAWAVAKDASWAASRAEAEAAPARATRFAVSAAAWIAAWDAASASAQAEARNKQNKRLHRMALELIRSAGGLH